MGRFTDFFNPQHGGFFAPARGIEHLFSPNTWQAAQQNKNNKPSFIIGSVQRTPTARPSTPVPTPAAITPTPTPAQTDPFAQYAALRQFHTKDNQAVSNALIQAVVNAANQNNVEPKLAGALAIQESNWNPSSVGTTRPPGYGLYQLTPGANPNANWDTNRLTTDPAYNAQEGLKLFFSGLADADKLGFTGEKRLRHALRRYNGGPNYYSEKIGWDNKRTVNQITKDYANSVLGYYNQQ